ncbi:hypothetical protein HHK36_017846 [Tetracentron sinense]|uniref:Annexin n=1 Tax=Tetracentron sinense TaxID=13715 RepID=A0A834Z3J1_TETSI|nr:hypothetical protein HHK36_017846 [Tetracentron sinense]
MIKMRAKSISILWWTDEKALISILGHRNAAQRKLIRLAYEETYQEDLLKRLESELSGDFERAVYHWTLDPPDRDAVLLNVALRKAIHDYRVVLEIACVHSPDELLAVKRAYQFRYKHSLEEVVTAHTSGDIRNLLVALVSTYRYNGDEINARVAHLEADILHNAIQEKAFNHEEVIRVLSTRSKAQIIATLNCYKDDHGTSITKILLGNPSDEFLAALRTAIQCINNPLKYFEKVLRNVIDKVGTDEDALSRVIVTRAEKDLEEIKELYKKRNNASLEHAVPKDTSGDYKDFLLTLLGSKAF